MVLAHLCSALSLRKTTNPGSLLYQPRRAPDAQCSALRGCRAQEDNLKLIEARWRRWSGSKTLSAERPLIVPPFSGTFCGSCRLMSKPSCKLRTTAGGGGQSCTPTPTPENALSIGKKKLVPWGPYIQHHIPLRKCFEAIDMGGRGAGPTCRRGTSWGKGR